MWRLFSSRADRKPATIPDGLRIYAVGDVHGRADLLEQVLSRIDLDLMANPSARALQIFLGDYVDRGPSSRQVIDRLVERQDSHELICLSGNHETYVVDFLKNPAILNEWRNYGGLETLMSYGLAPAANLAVGDQRELATKFARVLPEAHLQFLRTLRPCFSCGDYFFVHAGVRPGIPLSQQRLADMLWIREDFLLNEYDFGKIIVHGHTPVMEPDVRPNRINIDTGAYATGRITCLRLERDRLDFV